MRESTLESVAPSMPTFATLETWAPILDPESVATGFWRRR